LRIKEQETHIILPEHDDDDDDDDSNIKFHENRASENQVVPCGRAGRRNRDMTTPIVALRNFATALKNDIQLYFWSPLLYNGVVSPMLRMKQISRL